MTLKYKITGNPGNMKEFLESMKKDGAKEVFVGYREDRGNAGIELNVFYNKTFENRRHKNVTLMVNSYPVEDPNKTDELREIVSSTCDDVVRAFEYYGMKATKINK